MKDKIKRIENELNDYGDVNDEEDIRFLISLAKNWVKVQEIFQNPDVSVEKALDYLSNNT